MARINTLIDKVKAPQLRQLLLAEVSDIKKQKKFGLVFEEHVPEATPLYELPIVSGCLVSERDKQFVNYYGALFYPGGNYDLAYIPSTKEFIEGRDNINKVLDNI